MGRLAPEGGIVWQQAIQRVREPPDLCQGLCLLLQAWLLAQAVDQPKHADDHKERVPGFRLLIREVVNGHDLERDQFLYHFATWQNPVGNPNRIGRPRRRTGVEDQGMDPGPGTVGSQSAFGSREIPGVPLIAADPVGHLSIVGALELDQDQPRQVGIIALDRQQLVSQFLAQMVVHPLRGPWERAPSQGRGQIGAQFQEGLPPHRTLHEKLEPTVVIPPGPLLRCVCHNSPPGRLRVVQVGTLARGPWALPVLLRLHPGPNRTAFSILPDTIPV